MGGTISKEEIERDERVRISNMQHSLESLTELVKEYLRVPTAENKEKLRRAVYPPQRKPDTRSWLSAQAK